MMHTQMYMYTYGHTMHVHHTAISCPSPHIVDSNFNTPNGSYAYGSTITVECDRCRMIDEEENKALTCSLGGEWDKPLPNCKCELSHI